MQFTYVVVLAVATLCSSSTGQMIPVTFKTEVQPYPTGVPVPIDSEPSTLKPMPSQTPSPTGRHGGDKGDGNEDEISSMPMMSTGNEPATLDPDPTASIPLIPEYSSILMIPESSMMSATIPTPQAPKYYPRYMRDPRRRRGGPSSMSSVPDCTSEISTPDPTSLTQLLPESSMWATTLAI
ncbi:hypothetical protein MferCBS49748_002246 [Microsporum ferrugineum]